MDTYIDSAIWDKLDGIYAIAALIGLGVVLAGSRVRIRRQFKPTPLVGVLGLGLALRVIRLNEPLWYDETFTAAITGVDWSQLGDAIIADVHPPVYYTMIKALQPIVGTSEISLRLPSLVFGLVSILMMYHLVYRLFNRAHVVALISAFILAILPAHIKYSTEARAYMLLMLSAQVMFYGWITNRRALFAVGIMAMPLLHNIGYIYAASMIAAALAYKPRWLPTGFISSVPGAVWLPAMLHQSNDVSNGFWIPEPHAHTFIRHVSTMTVLQPTHTLDILLVIPAVFALTYSGLFAFRWMKRNDQAAWLAIGVATPAILGVASLVWRPVWLDRALLPAALILCVPLWAAAIRVNTKARLLAVVILPLALTTHLMAFGRDDINEYLDNCQGDSIYTVSTSTAIMALYYADERPVYLWADANDISQQLPNRIERAMGIHMWDGQSQPPGDYCSFVFFGQTGQTLYNADVIDVLISDYDRETVNADFPLYKIYTYEVRNYDR